MVQVMNNKWLGKAPSCGQEILIKSVQMLCFGGSLRWTPAVPWAAVDYQISTMSTSACTRLAATIERFRIATKTEVKHLITLSQFILAQ